MEAECTNFERVLMARLLEVSRKGFYKWRITQRRVDLTLIEQVRTDLREAGTRVSVNTVAAHMCSIDLAGISPRTFKVRTTMADL